MRNDGVNIQKSELRKEAKKFRSELTSFQKARSDGKITDNFLSLDCFVNAKTLLCYVSSSQEVDTSCIIKKALLCGKTVAVPKCTDNMGHMEFYIIQSENDLKPGAFGIAEPDCRCEKLNSFTDSLCVVPALVYSLSGFRLGFGKGYYDRFLSGYTGAKVGLAYGAQLAGSLPHDEFDIKANIIVSDKTVYYID